MKKTNTIRYEYRCLLIIFITILFPACSSQATLGGLLDMFGGEAESGSLTENEIVAGLKEALSKGAYTAINSLGQTDGYFRNKKVKIRMPEKLEKAEDVLRKLKQDDIADEFILSMNRAAEQAVPEAREILLQAIREISFADAKSILRGEDDAATRYFQRSSGQKLVQRMQPVVSRATNQVGVTARYKHLVDKLGIVGNLVDTKSLDLDRYITEKAVDGLFEILAEEERLIRENPAARTTDILKKVFSQ